MLRPWLLAAAKISGSLEVTLLRPTTTRHHGAAGDSAACPESGNEPKGFVHIA